MGRTHAASPRSTLIGGKPREREFQRSTNSLASLQAFARASRPLILAYRFH